MYLKKLYLLIIPILISSIVLSDSFIYRQNNKSTGVNSSISQEFPLIIIDAGHGGFDGGTSTDDGYPEKNINLAISLYLNDFLQFFGFETILTRDSDISLEDSGLTTIRKKKTSDIHNRMKITEENKNAVFISIHQNHYYDSKYSGMQVFYSRNFSQESTKLAEKIQESAVSLIQPENTRQIKECGSSVYLIYNAKIPSCLVECGFLSNFEEAQKLKTPQYQKLVAYSVALGILNYCKD